MQGETQGTEPPAAGELSMAHWDQQGRAHSTGSDGAAAPLAAASPGVFKALARIATAAAREHALERIVSETLDQCVGLLGAHVVYVCTVGVQGSTLLLAAERNLPAHYAERLARLTLEDDQLAAHAAMTRTEQVVTRDAPFAATMLDECGCSSMLAVPLIADGKLCGVFAFGVENGAPIERTIVRVIANVLATGIAKAQARACERGLRTLLERLQDASLAIAKEYELGDVLQRIADQARGVVGARHAALGITQADPELPFDPWVFSGTTPGEAKAIGRPPRPMGVLGAVARDGDVLQTPDVHGDMRFRGLPPNHPYIGSFLGVPIRDVDKFVGNLYVANKTGAAAFSDDDCRALEILAHHAAIAVAHAREHERAKHEIAERSRAEAALRKSEELFRLTFEEAPIGMALAALDGRFVRVNRSLCEMLGYPASELARLSFRDVTHPDDRRTGELIDRNGDGQEDMELPRRCVRRDGTTLHVAVHASVFGDGNDAQAHFILQVIDVTQRQRAEEERRRAEQERERLVRDLEAEQAWLRAVIERSPVATVLLEGAVATRVTMNRLAELLFGGAADATGAPTVPGRTLLDPSGEAVAGRDLPGARALRGELATPRELVLADERGARVPLLMSAAPILEGSGRTLGAVVLAEDLSSIKALERMREEWISIIAHDLRQPVTSISLYAGMQARRANGRAVKTAFEHILANARRLDRMIADLLDASRLESQRLDLKTQPVDVVALVRASLERISGPTRGGRLQLVADDAVPHACADPERVEQVLGNLVSNALKYGDPETPVDVVIEPGDGVVRVSVVNRGPGIPAGELSMLFDRFKRAGSARRRNVAGLGLGLYITRGLVEAHGGRIWAESTPGATTAFRFTLPRAGASARDSAAPTEA